MNLKDELRNSKETSKRLQDAMCMRQASFALQEKLLREVGGNRIDELWQYYVNTLNDLSKLFKKDNFPRYFQDQWIRVCKKYEITQDIDTLHRMIKHGNGIVHDTGFDHCSYEELITIIEKNVAPNSHDMKTWKTVVMINKTLSEARKEDLFTYSEFSTLAE